VGDNYSVLEERQGQKEKTGIKQLPRRKTL